MSNNGDRAERDGCGCPAYVRCAHFEGRILWLVDTVKGEDEPGMAACRLEVGKAYIVGQGRPGVCRDCGKHPTLLLSGSFPPFSEYDDLPAATAEFDRRELELLGREAS